jgi:hypothetical protein
MDWFNTCNFPEGYFFKHFWELKKKNGGRACSNAYSGIKIYVIKVPINFGIDVSMNSY